MKSLGWHHNWLWVLNSPMFRNYLSIAYRTLLKNKAFSFINLLGLAIGMAAFLFIIRYVRFERSYEGYNKNASNIFRVTLDLYKGNEYVVTDCETYAAVGPMLKDKMPEVLDFARMYHNDGLQDIRIGAENFLEEGIYFADPSAIEFFTLDLIRGNKSSVLTEPHKAVISESMAEKFFNSTDIVGEAIEIQGRLYQVTGVMADLPRNTHLKFDILLSHSTLPKIYSWYAENSWNGNNEYTYLLMKEGTDINSFNKKLIDFAVSLKEEIGSERFVAEPITDIHLFSNKSFEPELNGSARVVNFLLIIAVFIILIAWVNYVNLSTARAIERAREVGIRKVMGSLKLQLIFQFLSESVLINLTAAILAFVFFHTGLPLFRELTGQRLTGNFSVDPDFWYTFLGLVLIGSMLSGLYPAFVLSSFKPVAVLKGQFRSSSHGHQLRKGLVVLQFAATVILMVGMSVVYLQINYLRSYELGMDLEQTIVVRAPHHMPYDSIQKSRYENLKTKWASNANVLVVSHTETVPGLSLHELSTTSSVTKVGAENDQESYNYYFVAVDANYIPALNLKLISGRNFEQGVPNHESVVINEETISRLGFANAEEAIGSKITFNTRHDGGPSTIIGVIKNYYQQSPKESQIPMIFYCGDNNEYFSIKVKGEEISQSLASIKKSWDEVFPNTLFHYFFLDEKYDQQYQADSRFGKVIATFTTLAVFIACLGLFGLSSYTIIQRTKEIGIRKVLGASVLQIVHLLSKDFAKIVLLAAILALPIAYFAVEQWLSGYAIRVGLNLWIFLIPVSIILFIAFSTVSLQTIKTALENPSGSLRQE
jgi:putative ABC transport system permease protein